MAFLLHQKADEIEKPVGSRFWDELPSYKRGTLVDICEAVLEALDLEEYFFPPDVPPPPPPRKMTPPKTDYKPRY